MDYETLELTIENTGLLCRGGFHPGSEDEGLEGVATVVLIGNAGSRMWDIFSVSPEYINDDGSGDPLDVWSRRVLEEAAAELGAHAIFPFEGPPYYPFQKWSMRAEQVWQSPIGPLLHPEFGLWHAYRGALLFPGAVDIEAPSSSPSPCETCADQPCLRTCPVDAFSVGKYDVPACARHIKSPEGQGCMNGGCMARCACPLGQSYHYSSEHAYFHMHHFLKNHR